MDDTFELEDWVKALALTDPAFAKKRQQTIADGYQRFVVVARRQRGTVHEAVVVPVL